MSTLTNFFVASPAQLESAFPGWLAVQMEPAVREFTNPYNGHKHLIKEWIPLPGQIPSTDSHHPDLSGLPIAYLKNVELLKLCSLKWVLSGAVGAEYFADELSRPALIHPNNEDCGLYQLPELLVTDLAGILPTDVPNLGKRWWTEEEIAREFSVEECSEVIGELARLGGIAKISRAGMFLFLSL